MQPLSLDSRHSRSGLLQRAVVAGGALTAGGLIVAGLPKLASAAPSPAQDVRVLNLALLLEYIEAAFYAEARAKGALRGELRQFAEVVGGHEQQHLTFLKKTLGAKARAKPRMVFGKATTDPDAFVASALALEDTGVAAYNGQATNLTAGALAAAARIVSVEARHAAWIRSIAGKTPAADATDPSLTEAQALAALRKTGFLRS
ncbi:MAG: ferritin-like domain-containing protein [Actinomycetota bacterium]|nr:ferritin-like domain-containing protein [Actinomycetota bacterium]